VLGATCCHSKGIRTNVDPSPAAFPSQKARLGSLLKVSSGELAKPVLRPGSAAVAVGTTIPPMASADSPRATDRITTKRRALAVSVLQFTLFPYGL
jgi:hypothetical protein